MSKEQKERPEDTTCVDCRKEIPLRPLRDRCGPCSTKYWDGYVKSTKNLGAAAEKAGPPFSTGGTFDG